MHISLVYIQSSDFGIGVYNWRTHFRPCENSELANITDTQTVIRIVKTYVDVSKI